MAEVESKRTDALTLYYAMAVQMEGGTVFDMVPHLYRPEELRAMREAQDRAISEREERERQMSLYKAMLAYAQTHGGIKDDRHSHR